MLKIVLYPDYYFDFNRNVNIVVILSMKSLRRAFLFSLLFEQMPKRKGNTRLFSLDIATSITASKLLMYADSGFWFGLSSRS